MPRPQNAGDSLLAYITTVQPQVSEKTVILGARALSQRFKGPRAVSSIKRRVLDRGQVTTFATRGAGLIGRDFSLTHLRPVN